MKACALVGAILVGTAAIAAPVLAHHSGAMFDRTKQVTMVGTFNHAEWVSPHAWIHIDVPDTGGQTKTWAVEMGGGAGRVMGMGGAPAGPR